MAVGIGGLPSLGSESDTDQPRADIEDAISVGRPDERAGQSKAQAQSRAAAERLGAAQEFLPRYERPRERLALHGAGALSAAELIGVLWGSGTHGHTAIDAAFDALRRHEGLVGLARATDVELEAVPGVGPVRAAQLSAAFELGRRLVTDWPQGRWTVHAPRDVGDGSCRRWATWSARNFAWCCSILATPS
jgi:hypothetical protein